MENNKNQVIDYRPKLNGHNDFTQAGQGRLFNSFYRDVCKATKESDPVIWTGTNWEINKFGPTNLYLRLTDAQYAQASEEVIPFRQAVEEAEDGDDKARLRHAKKDAAPYEAYVKHASTARSAFFKEGSLGFAFSENHVSLLDFDKDGYALNTPNGLYNLCTGASSPNNPKQMCMSMTSVAPGDRGEEFWVDFLIQVSGGDKTMMHYLKQIAGMALTGVIKTEALIIAYGEGGNGKSTFFGALQNVFGSYATTASTSLLIADHKNNDKEFKLVALLNKRLVIMAETKADQELDDETVKKISSVDKITASYKHKDGFEFKPTHTPVMFTNHLPRVTALDRGLWRRIAVVPFTSTFANTKEEVKNYAEFLSEKAGPYILKWAIEGAVEFNRNGGKLVDIPQSVVDATARYQAETMAPGQLEIAEILADYPPETHQYEMMTASTFKTYHSVLSRFSSQKLNATFEYMGIEHVKVSDTNKWLLPNGYRK